MPVRQNFKIVDSAEVQGEGSWVKVRRLTYGEIKDIQASADDKLTQSVEVVRAVVLDWNWVDDSGAALPKPSDDPFVIHKLTDEEIAFIGKAMNSEQEKKALPTG